MTPAAVHGLIARRGVRAIWMRAIPVPVSSTDSFFDAPVPVDGAGTFGEHYPTPAEGVPLVGYFHEAKRNMQSMAYGIADEKDATLTFAVPFEPDPYHNVPNLEDPRLLAIFNAGQFIQYSPSGEDGSGIAIDRFLIRGQLYTSSGVSPKYDADTVFAYALTLKAMT